MTRYYTTIIEPADSIHAIDNLTSEMGMSTEGAILATVATVSFFVLSLIGFLSVVFYLCTCSKKRKNKRCVQYIETVHLCLMMHVMQTKANRYIPYH